MRLILLALLIYLIYQAIKPRALAPKGGMDGNDDPDNASSRQLDDVMVKDPYCNVYFPKRTGIHLEFEGKNLYFCSKACRDKFIALNGKREG
ncbi:MAG: YHS domain-containing protein [Desulfobacterales bacterium]|nr:YHS domain-containing protein [Desulfobacterales bacterium]MDD4071836.1 YHS domain-containing protein [Desulfobacterales bacterium]MDD4392543.1 YHS domain-containing protein [Desulfobacterales bacterium]